VSRWGHGDGGDSRTIVSGSARPDSAAVVAPSRALTATELAWVALLPCALLTVVAIVVLGPLLGHALFTHTSDSMWPPGWWEAEARPEPSKQGRYLIATLGPVLLAAAILVGRRQKLGLPPRLTRTISFASLAAVLALVVVALLTQRPAIEEDWVAPAIFGVEKVVAAVAIVLILLAVARRRTIAARIAALGQETRLQYYAAAAIAVGFAAIWLLKAIVTDDLGEYTPGINLPWTLNDAIAVLDGRTPLVDYHPIYAKLLPYPTALVLSAFGTTSFVYSVFMAVLDVFALLAVYAIFRRVTRRSLYALALFLPFVATSDINAAVEGSPMTMSALWPMRYGGAYLLAWLTVRQLDGDSPRRAWIIFLVGGVVTINSMEFGIAAVLASVAALLCARPPQSVRDASRLAGSVAAGALGAIALVALITLARTGRLPDLDLLFEWPRIFTTLGWFSMPLRTLDLHVAIYATYAAAIAVAAVRLSRRDPDVVLTGMLAWSGVFGLLSGGYFVGRPDIVKIVGILSAWSFALALLTVVCVRALAAQRWRPTLPQVLVLFGFALSVSSLAAISLPQTQVARITQTKLFARYLPSAERVIGERTRRGEKVMILVPMSYAIAHDLGLRNVAPYAFMNAIVARSQMRTVIDTLRREHIRAIFTPAPGSGLRTEGDSAAEQLELLEAIGYVPTITETGIVEFRRS
jgi:hypothetical protein